MSINASALFAADKIWISILNGQRATYARAQQPESEQIAAAIQKNSGNATYVLYPDEGYDLINEMRQSKTMGTLGKVTPTMILLLTLCMSSVTQAIPDYKPPSCINTPPYDTVTYKAEKFVRVAPGVKLELLDWGCSGLVMLLLSGSGDNAHVFDYFAFQFTNFFHVIAITRRGWLPSSQSK
ncbi:MAG TPA: hypothetical protein VGI36_05295, partial [Candidatus Binataceae bacterium]